LRAKRLEAGAFLALCHPALTAARPFAAQIVVNDRVDLARMAGAAGAHVGQEDLPPRQARDILGSDAILGVSTHSVDQIEGMVREPVSYIAVGPVFGTGSKDTGYDAVGLDLVREAARRAGRLPIVAIGGITLDTAASVLAAGATSVAIISDLLATGDPRSRAAAYLRTLGSHRV
jgi:thiamine-phosphate diphosphorylase